MTKAKDFHMFFATIKKGGMSVVKTEKEKANVNKK